MNQCKQTKHATDIAEKIKIKQMSLEIQYKFVANDEASNKEFKDWEDLMIGDGLNDQNGW